MNGQDHHHEHDEACTCGHDHAHEHKHDEQCSGEIHVECHLHDEARVISGRLTVTGAYDTVRIAVSLELERIAKAVQTSDGIVGHIKASCEVKTVEMFSVTDTDVSVKTAPEQEIKINLAAIVFLIDPEQAEALAHHALETIRTSRSGDL